MRYSILFLCAGTALAHNQYQARSDLSYNEDLVVRDLLDYSLDYEFQTRDAREETLYDVLTRRLAMPKGGGGSSGGSSGGGGKSGGAGHSSGGKAGTHASHNHHAAAPASPAAPGMAQAKKGVAEVGKAVADAKHHQYSKAVGEAAKGVGDVGVGLAKAGVAEAVVGAKAVGSFYSAHAQQINQAAQTVGSIVGAAVGIKGLRGIKRRDIDDDDVLVHWSRDEDGELFIRDIYVNDFDDIW